MDINFTYRTWYLGLPPNRIKLQIPGWAGKETENEAQPYHCKPFNDASTYGFELLYPFKTEVVVRTENNKCIFEGDFEKNDENQGAITNNMPFANFAEGHFGFTSSLDICTDEGWGTLLLPHPRYYTDRSGDVPLPVSGLIESDFWARIFFIVFKAPLEGQKYVFRYLEPYAQVIFVPKKVNYNCRRMTASEEVERIKQEGILGNCVPNIATHIWKDNNGSIFDNKYKLLSRLAKTSGVQAVKDCLMEAQTKKIVFDESIVQTNAKKIKRKLFK